MAAAIQKKFGVDVNLVEGHHGIYEIAIDGESIFSNQNKGSNGFPSNGEIFQRISVYTPALADVQNTTDVN
ncbi:MAG: Rdx family protein [Anaerolineaceae bacterium]|nr:Rdx family protein [Anaerolineaceae bacterium]